MLWVRMIQNEKDFLYLVGTAVPRSISLEQNPCILQGPLISKNKF
jgi:hypothetical protein